MKFLNSAEIREWYENSLKYSGYSELKDWVFNIWKHFVLHGRRNLPPGLMARLIENIVHIETGTKKDKNYSSKDNLIIDLILKDKNISLLEGEFLLSVKISNEKIKLILECIFEKLHSISVPIIKFTPKDLEKAIEIEYSHSGEPELMNLLAQINESIYDEAQLIPKFIDDTDYFEIKHPNLFTGELRIKTLFKKISQFSKKLRNYAISDISLPQENDAIVQKYGEPQILPLGGYESLINRGDFSSLVPSELAFIDETEKIDFFDYKYLQNELLFYKREEGMVFRIRRCFTIVLKLGTELELESNLAILFSFCIILMEKLAHIFIKDIVEIHAVFHGTFPSGMDYAMNFFEHFISELNFQKQTFFHIVKPPGIKQLYKARDTVTKEESMKELYKSKQAMIKANELIMTELNKITKNKTYQHWIIDENNYKNYNFVPINFPSFEDFKIDIPDVTNEGNKYMISDEDKARILGDRINRIIVKVVENAYCSTN